MLILISLKGDLHTFDWMLKTDQFREMATNEQRRHWAKSTDFIQAISHFITAIWSRICHLGKSSSAGWRDIVLSVNSEFHDLPTSTLLLCGYGT
ncbi:hypothetical protein XELAEV_18029686mg [Xenopus laevis]|uniref:Uncharacterized protein n=1 Tax=Xenopus laevis TaxID=8355 RepID=A0A974CRW5_XENLA|nr:hypothetical protein XELAEV_18029686mg [Xenopus laevis]